MQSFKDFQRWHNNKNVVPTLEAMQKMVKFYHRKGINMLKLGCTFSNLANIFLHSSTSAKFHPFTESDKDLLSKIRQDLFTRKTVVGETHIRKSKNVCKLIVGLDASQFYPYSMCHRMPTGFYTRYDFDSNLQNF